MKMLPFSTRRSCVYSQPGGAMTCCTQPTAAEFGAEILRAGGNAADACIAVAAGMQLLEPCSTGLGGDCFALYYDAKTQQVTAMNGSGRSASTLSLSDAQKAAGPGVACLPNYHPFTITVPGAAAGWCDTISTWGSLPMATVLAPAIRAAEAGVCIAPVTAVNWAKGAPQIKQWRELYGAEVQDEPTGLLLTAADGSLRAPHVGEVWRNPSLASVLRTLAAQGAQGFYAGAPGQAIVAAVHSVGGKLSLQDLLEHRSEFVTPLSVDFCGARIWECPPNGQGIVALVALGILREYGALHAGRSAEGAQPPLHSANGLGPFAAPYAAGGSDDLCSAGSAEASLRSYLAGMGGHASPAQAHVILEALRLAFADARAYVTDPHFMNVPPGALLEPSYLRSRAALIHPTTARADVAEGRPIAGTDTVSFSVVDGQGNACSFINSNYMGFGSGLVPVGCGFSLQNRGANFSLLPGHPNVLGPGRRPYHTIIPALATRVRDGSLLFNFSNMGGFMQPQGHVQLLVATLVHGLDPQSALDAPRLCIGDGTANGQVAVEEGAGQEDVAHALRRAGHAVSSDSPVTGHARSLFGRGQFIYRSAPSTAGSTAVLCGGSDGRGDGQPMPVAPLHA